MLDLTDRYEQYVEDAYVEYLKRHNRPDEVGVATSNELPCAEAVRNSIVCPSLRCIQWIQMVH